MSDETRSNPGRSWLILLLALLGFGLALRLYGLGAEPFWRDELYSAAFSDNSMAEVLEDNARDVHPPLYYLGLHVWRGFFGDSADGMRGYSMVWSLIGLLAVFLLAREIGGRQIGLTALFLAAVNAADIYVAQEARMYAQAAALCTLASWCLWRWMAACGEPPGPQRWWPWAVGYALSAAAALQTHYVAVLVLVAQGIFALLWMGRYRRWSGVAGYLGAAVFVALAFLPWFWYVRHLRGALYSPTLGWLGPQPASEYFAFLGHEFFWGHVRRVGAPWRFAATVLAVAALGYCLWCSWKNRFGVPPSGGLEEDRLRPGLRTCVAGPNRTGILYCAWLLAGPVLLAAVAVASYHPIYYRPRFAQFVLAPFLILLAVACNSLGRRAAKASAVAILGTLMLAGTYIQQHTCQKIEWDRFGTLWQQEGPPAHIIFFPRNLESDARRALGQPFHSATERELEESLPRLQGARLWIASSAGYAPDKRSGEFGYYQRLLHLGSVRSAVLRTGLQLQTVTVGEHSLGGAFGARVEREYAPLDVPGLIEGFGKSERFHMVEYEGPQKLPFRWSLPKAWFSLAGGDDRSTVVLNVQLPPPVAPGYTPKLRLYAMRGETESGLFDTNPIVIVDDNRPGVFEVEIAPLPGAGKLWIGWKIRGINLFQYLGTGAYRVLGLRVNWVGAVHTAGQEIEARRGQKSLGREQE